MTIDQLLDTREAQRVVEAMAQAVWDEEYGADHSKTNAFGVNYEWRAFVEQSSIALRAALSVRSFTPCLKCDELGFLRAGDADIDCPDCTDGQVLGPPLLADLLALWEM